MIVAGEEAFYDTDRRVDGMDGAVRNIFLAMWRARQMNGLKRSESCE